MSWRRRLQLAAAVAFLLTYTGLSHYSNSAASTHDLGVVLALGPVLAVGIALVWRWTSPPVALLAGVAAALLLLRCWPAMEENFSVVYLLQEAGLYSLLALSFGLSLRGSQVALCTQLADKIHGPLSARDVWYTRRVTAAWSIFFGIITAATVALFVCASLRTRSLFANFFVFPLICLMFVAEYAVRSRVLPQTPRPGILAAVRVDFASSP